MLEKLTEKLKEEETQRQILSGVSFVAIFVASRAFSYYMDKGAKFGIDQLMSKLHPDTVTATVIE